MFVTPIVVFVAEIFTFTIWYVLLPINPSTETITFVCLFLMALYVILCCCTLGLGISKIKYKECRGKAIATTAVSGLSIMTAFVFIIVMLNIMVFLFGL